AKALRALAELNTVAGNHSRFLFDFAPESIVLRITQDAAPRLLYCFDSSDDGKTVTAPALMDRVLNGDIDPKELVLGAPFSRSDAARQLQSRGAAVPEPSGVQAAVQEAILRIEAAVTRKE